MLYRLRPAANTTIDELKNEYLWFSKPGCFKDKTRDANISAFIRDNEGLETAFSRIYTKIGIKELSEKSKNIGICCFTDNLPSNRASWKSFPNGLNSIVIGYDDEKLKELFLKIGKYNPFVAVEYVDNPLTLEMDNGITYIKERIDDKSYILHNIDGAIRYDPNHAMEDIMTLLLTRISSEYSKQHEYRVFLSGIHMNYTDENGYQFKISNDCINHIFIPRRVVNHNIDFIQNLTSIKAIESKLKFL